MTEADPVPIGIDDFELDHSVFGLLRAEFNGDAGILERCHFQGEVGHLDVQVPDAVHSVRPDLFGRLGEIAGEYFLSNSNLLSHQFRAHVTPTDKVGGGLIFYDFRIAQPTSYGPTVTGNHAAFEGDLYVDWKATKNVLVSVVTAFANPGLAVQQLTGRTKNFAYGMLYVAYSY